MVLPYAVAGAVVAYNTRKQWRAKLRKLRNRLKQKKCTVEEDVPELPQLDPVTLQWSDVHCELTVAGKQKGTTKTRAILHNAKGEAKPGRLKAIIGPSGSGKTTLLNILAGQLPQSAKVTTSGRLTANGRSLSDCGQKTAYVRQEDVFYSQLTVRETLTMAAKLHLPSFTPGQQEAYVRQLMAELGIVAAADTIVGDVKTRGCSGGEKKRLAIGCELVGQPAVIFADEPTSGLDAFQAERVMGALRDLAHDKGRTVVVSIHQPRSSIVSMIDDLVLLSEGRVVYSGPMDEAVGYFARAGYRCPPAYNPAEFFIDQIAIDYSSEAAEVASRARVEALAAIWAVTSPPIAHMAPEPVSAGGGWAAGGEYLMERRLNWGGQFRLLLGRSWKQVTRDRTTNMVRAMTNLTSALIFGGVYWRLGVTQAAVQSRTGLLQVAVVNTAMSSLMKTIGVFPKERTIVARERAGGRGYDIAPYLASKLVAELPVGMLFPALFGSILYPMTGLHATPWRFARFMGVITAESFAAGSLGLAISALAPSAEAATAMGPSIMVIFIIFGGLYVNETTVPLAFRWLPKVSLIKQAFAGLCVNDLRGLKLTAKNKGDSSTGDQVLRRMAFGSTSVGGSMAAEGRIILVNYLLTYWLLNKNKPQFQALEPRPTVQLTP